MDKGVVAKVFAWCDFLRFFPSHVDPDTTKIPVGANTVTRDGALEEWKRDRAALRSDPDEPAGGRKKGKKGKNTAKCD